MRKLNLFKYGLTALMMAFAMTLCFSCSSDDDEGTNQEEKPSSKSQGIVNGHDYVELAGIKWATENVGAVNGVDAEGSEPTYGYYYNWDNAKKAAASWGGKWTLPTISQWQALIVKCDWKRMDKYFFGFGSQTMKGYLVTDKYNGNSVFLPAADHCDDGKVDVDRLGNYGMYWSSTSGKNKVYRLFYNGVVQVDSTSNRNKGCSVRPVLME